MAGVRLVWERVRWEVRQGQVVWMEFRIPAHVAVPGSLLQVKALCSHCGGAGGGSPELSHRPSTLAQSRGWIQPPLTGCLPSVRPRSTPASAARLLCLMALQSRSPPCPHTAPASHHQAPSKSTAQPALARAPSGSHPQRSTPASALRRGLRAVPGASSRAAMCPRGGWQPLSPDELYHN